MKIQAIFGDRKLDNLSLGRNLQQKENGMYQKNIPVSMSALVGNASIRGLTSLTRVTTQVTQVKYSLRLRKNARTA